LYPSNYYACFDRIDELATWDSSNYEYVRNDWTYEDCKRRGVLKNGIPSEMIDELEQTVTRTDIPGKPNFLWSNELAMSASMVLEDTSGCTIHPDQAIDD